MSRVPSSVFLQQCEPPRRHRQKQTLGSQVQVLQPLLQLKQQLECRSHRLLSADDASSCESATEFVRDAEVELATRQNNCYFCYSTCTGGRLTDLPVVDNDSDLPGDKGDAAPDPDSLTGIQDEAVSAVQGGSIVRQFVRKQILP
mmetsp:Transcript_14412/g.23815  ORF Transcript_14412/g.23815 Transcript_14412/m.23815 type:complete len:145 (-) Transcript_14412:1265-1699(-)